MKQFILRKKTFFMSLALLVVIIIGFGNALVGDFVLEDNQLIVDNPSIRQINYIPTLFKENVWINSIGQINAYRPLLTTSFSIDWLLWGDEPFGYHLSSLLLHLIACILLWRVLALLMPKKAHLAYISTLIFAIHPVNTEAVTYISARGYLLASVFSLVAVYAWIKMKKDEGVRWHILTSLALLGGLLSHEAVLMLPVVLLLIDIYKNWTSKGKSQINALHYIVPLVIWLGYITLRLTVLSFGDLSAESGLITRVLTFFGVVWQYLGIIITPFWLNTSHQVVPAESMLSMWHWVSGIIWFAAILISFRFLSKRPYITFGVLWMALWLIPHMGILEIDPVFKEKHLYLPLMGGIVAFIGLVDAVIGQIKQEKTRTHVGVACIAIALLASSVITIKRNMAYANEKDFYIGEIEVSENSEELRNALAKRYLEESDWENAKNHIDFVLEKNPENIYALVYKAHLYLKNREPEVAIENLEKALSLAPGHETLLYSLGRANILAGNFSAAITHLQEAVKLRPYDPDVNRELALAMAKSLRYDDAEYYFKKALEINPADSMSYFYLGGIYHNERLYQEAVINFSKAVAVDPENKVAKLYLEKAQELLDLQKKEIMEREGVK